MPSSVAGAAPSARAWTSTLPSAVASAGPATTGSPHASAVSWHSSSLRDPPPTMCTTSACSPGQRLRVAQRAPVSEGQAVKDAPDDLGGGRRHGCPRAASQDAIRAGMSPGGRNTGSSASMTTATGRRRPRPEQRFERARRRSQCALALLQQPQAADVAQVPDGPVDPGLVGEVRRPARLGEHGRGQFHPDQGPGAARRCRRSRARRRAPRPPRTRCRASRRRSAAAAAPRCRECRGECRVAGPARSPRPAGAAAGTARARSRRAP